MDNAMKRHAFDATVWLVALAMGLILIAQQAMAGSNAMPADNVRWKAECGSCHVAYPPHLLPAPAWNRIMAGLDKHFGTDASVDAQTTAEIKAFLDSHAGRDWRAWEATETLRITETAWFRRKHREISAATWKHPAVKGAPNCAACHTAAEQGDFRERNIRVPR